MTESLVEALMYGAMLATWTVVGAAIGMALLRIRMVKPVPGAVAGNASEQA